MEIKKKRKNCPIYDFKDGEIVTKLPEPSTIKDGKRKVKVDRIIHRKFCDRILEHMYECMQHIFENERDGISYIDTTDHDIAMINSYLKTGVIDDTYNRVCNNRCIFTDELKEEINRLWKNRE